MGQVTASTSLAAAPDKVWDEFSNPSNFEKWLTIHTKWKDDPPAAFSEGAQVAQVLTMLGMANTITWTVKKFEPPHQLAISGTGMAGVQVGFTLSVEPIDTGSKATIEAKFAGAMIVGALGAAVEKDARKQLDLSLEKFAALVG